MTITQIIETNNVSPSPCPFAITIGITKITVSGTIVAIVLIAAGFIFAFFGHRFFKITLFIAGFYVFSKFFFCPLPLFCLHRETLICRSDFLPLANTMQRGFA